MACAKTKQSDLAAHLDLSTRSVRELLDKGVLTCDRQSIDLDQCRLDYIRYLRNRAAQWEKEEDDKPVDDSRNPEVQLALLRVDQRELIRIKKRKALAEVVDRKDVNLAISTVFARVFQLAAQPQKPDGRNKRKIDGNDDLFAELKTVSDFLSDIASTRRQTWVVKSRP